MRRGFGGSSQDMPAASQAASAGGTSLARSRNAHPTMRLDSFLRTTDTGYQHAEAPTQGDRFVRKMATYGQVRPSVSFISEPRVTRPVQNTSAVDMSNLPPSWVDPKADPRELTFEIPPPPTNVNTEFIDMYKNHSLMLPSERYQEHLKMKAGELQWRKDRADTFMYKKRMNVLERKHPEGIIGVDGPLYPETTLYRERHDQLAAQAQYKADHAEMRYGNLAQQTHTDDAVAFRDYGTDPQMQRSKDICIQRKCVDPAIHPFRFLDTHDRLFPKYTPVWDPGRASAQRSHDVRDKRHNIISGTENVLTYNVAKSWEEVQAEAMATRIAKIHASQREQPGDV
mmetsp:Transcript_95222/g.171926  ORF Transcript_95222/g.171926 Transcript_95222/m.171926 type:complete len:341 (-) Transcript_95222:1-1023(-)